MTKIAFISLGCAKNQVDLERVAGATQKKFEFTNDPSECDYMVINTCGFLQEAVQEAIDAILSMNDSIKNGAKLIVFGCMSERYNNEFKSELPEVDFFAGVGFEAMQSVVDYIFQDAFMVNNDIPEVLTSDRYLFNAPYYAYLKIAEGCNNRCTYCAIPSIRGNHKSVPLQELLSEAQRLADGGVKEIIVVSQDTTKYGSDLKDSNNVNLSVLLIKLSELLPNIYFRLMYLNPDGVTLELVRTVKNLPNVLDYFDIPIQHGSDRILKLMNRHSNSEVIDKVFNMIRSELPEAFIRTTMIVGFPSENDKDFAASLEFIKSYKPDFAGFFPYSPEDGTKAAEMEGLIPEDIINQRMLLLQKAQESNTVSKLEQTAKQEILCYVEQANEDFEFILEGRAFFQAPEVDGKLYVIDSEPLDDYGPYRALIKKIAYPDVYVEILGAL